MRKWILFFCTIIISCSSKQEMPNPQDDIETAQVFLQALANGNFDVCSKFILPNSKNESLLKSQLEIFNQKTSTQKKDIQESSIIIHNREEITENETVITYNTSFNKTIYKLKLIKKENKWLVDFGYTFNGNL